MRLVEIIIIIELEPDYSSENLYFSFIVLLTYGKKSSIIWGGNCAAFLAFLKMCLKYKLKKKNFITLG